MPIAVYALLVALLASDTNVYEGELVRYPGPWSFQLGRSSIILVNDDELEALADPDAVLDLSLTHDKVEKSLRQVCEEAQARGAQKLIIAFDHFFRQYRPGQDRPRRYTPDMDEYIDRMAAISNFAADYGLGLELSLLNPLEIGPAYRAATGESGRWMHYREGLRDPKTGAFSVQLWRQKRWANNKGIIDVENAGVRVFAFREQLIGGTHYTAVDPAGIVEITEGVEVEVYEALDSGSAVRIRVHGKGHTDAGPLDRVLVVQQYRTPEMDYFSENALPFLKNLLDKYVDAGVELYGLYSDEMHIQQDWGYHRLHDNGEFAVRYVSDGLARRFAELYGPQYADFAKYLVYFVHGQNDYAHDVWAKSGKMHVFGATPQAIRETSLFRARYYRLLQDDVVDLVTEAKHHIENRLGRRLEARAHATWAESPTIDRWDVGRQHHPRHQYEYTSNFVWSATVHQASAACHDYFKWNDYLTGGGNDHAEGGWLDRNYYGIALACSTGILNEIPYAYAAHWGMPHEIRSRRTALVNAAGAAGSPLFGLVQGMEHRDVDVLMLYPIDLVAVEERFGSWMTQYAYTNYVTQDKLLERGAVRDGAIEMAGRRFTTLVALFEPFPADKLLAMARELAKQGGRVVWSGPPPVLTRDAGDALTVWRDLFGVDYTPGCNEGLIGPGRRIAFEGALAGVEDQVVLTDFLVDRLYPVTPREGTTVAGRSKDLIVATHRKVAEKGSVTFLGYRPRDDQAASLGYETRNWFEVLDALGAYPPTGKIADVNDNTEYVSRTTPVYACRFPNGAVGLAPHFHDMEEGWPGGFGRDREADQKYLEENPPPSDALVLNDFHVNGHVVDYSGTQAMAFRTNASGELIAFAGSRATEITIDGRTFVFADRPFGQVAWGPVEENRRVEGGAVLQFLVRGQGTLRIPLAGVPHEVEAVLQGRTPGSRGEVLSSRIEDGALVIELPAGASGRWGYVVPRAVQPERRGGL